MTQDTCSVSCATVHCIHAYHVVCATVHLDTHTCMYLVAQDTLSCSVLYHSAQDTLHVVHT